MTVFRESLRLLREVYGGFGGFGGCRVKSALRLLREVHGGFGGCQCLQPSYASSHIRDPKLRKETSAELRMAVLTLLKERSV